jgi:signal peptidase I
MAMVVVILVIGFTINFLFGTINPFYVVVSGSMIPNLNIGDLLVIDHNYNYNNLKVGDVIVFNTPGVNDKGQHLTIVHRVAEIITVPSIERGGSNNDQNNDNHNNNIIKIIRTKGDANPGSIRLLDYPIRQQNYIGKVVYVIPKVGLVTMVIRPPINYIIIGAIVIVIVYFIRRQMMQQQQEGRRQQQRQNK